MNVFKFLLYTIVFMIMFFSGEMRIYNQIFGEKISVLLFFVFSFLLYQTGCRPRRIIMENLRILAPVVTWIILVNYFFNHDTTTYKGIVTCIYLLSMCLIASSVNFGRFKNVMLLVANIIAVASIVVQFAYNLGLVGATDPHLQTANSPRALYLFNVDWSWAGEGRLASIYHEPGQYQIVLTYIICMFADELSDIKRWFKPNIKKFGIIILAFILTKSTMGYVVMGLVFFTMVTNVLLDGKNKLIFPVIIGIAYLVFILIYSSDAIQMKIEQSQNLNAHSSFAIRFADNVALLESIKDKPITGWGSDSLSLLKTLVNRGSVTNSNGVFLAAAELGVVYVFMWFVMLFRGLRRIYNLQLAIGLSIALMLTQMNEVGYFLPIIFIYLFRFKDSTKYSSNV